MTKGDELDEVFIEDDSQYNAEEDDDDVEELRSVY